MPTSPPPLKAIYVRLPQDDAARLDAVAASTGVSKQRLVGEAVRGHLDGALEAGGDRLVVGRAALREPVSEVTPDPQLSGEVMTLGEVAVLLRVDERQVRRSAEESELPGRLIGDDWRFARAAVLSWLAREQGFARS